MKLYYTGAKTYLGEQKDSQLSLGGLISSTEIPNGLLTNLFGAISKLTVQQNKEEVRAFVIKNDGLTALTGLKAYFTYPNDGASPPTDTNDCEFAIGYATVQPYPSGDLYIEKVDSIYAIPYSVTLVDGAVGVTNALALPDLDAGNYLGIFVKRTLKPATQQPLSDTDLAAILDGTLILPTTEAIGLTFSWI